MRAAMQAVDKLSPQAESEFSNNNTLSNSASGINFVEAVEAKFRPLQKLTSADYNSLVNGLSVAACKESSLALSAYLPPTICPQEGECLSAYPGDNLHANNHLLSSHRKGRRRKTVGVSDESTTGSITDQVAPPPLPPIETNLNNEATSSQSQCVFSNYFCHDLLLIWAKPVLKIPYRISKCCHCWRAVQSYSWPLHQHCFKCQS